MRKRGSATTEPGVQMRPRSLRSMSTIMTCSAWFLGSVARKVCWAASSGGVSPRGAVPFMGRVRMRLSWMRKKSSGEKESVGWESRWRMAAKSTGCCSMRVL